MKITLHVEVDSLPELTDIGLALSQINVTAMNTVRVTGVTVAQSTEISGSPPGSAAHQISMHAQVKRPPGTSAGVDYSTLKTLRAVVAAIIEKEGLKGPLVVVPRCLEIKASGACPVLAMIPDEDLPERVASTLEALGY